MNSQHSSVSPVISTSRMSQKLIRMQRLKELMDSRGYTSVGDFAKALNRSTSQVSDLLRGAIPFGEKVARNIEHAAQLPTGWLDQISSIQPDTLYGQTVVELVTIPFVEIRATDGVPGYAVENIKKSGTPVFFTQQWISENGLHAPDLKCSVIEDDSMGDSLMKGDIATYSTGLTELIERKIYVLKYENEIVYRRLIRDEGAWWISCDNTDKRLWPRKKMTDDTIVIGQVVHYQRSLV